MRVRLALEKEADAVVEMTRAAMAEARPWLAFDEAKARESFERYLDTAEPTIFVAEQAGQLVGFASASIMEYRAAGGLFVVHEVLFVRPEHRGSRAAALLVHHLLAWSRSLGATEIVSGNDSDIKSEKVERFLGRLGFKRVGYAMRQVF